MHIQKKKLTRNGIGTRNPKAKPKVYSSRAEDLIVLLLFAVSFSALEQEYQDIYHAYHITDQVISDLKDTKRDIENHFTGWFKFATDMAPPVCVDPKYLERQSVGVASGITFLVLTVRATIVDHLLLL